MLARCAQAAARRLAAGNDVQVLPAIDEVLRRTGGVATRSRLLTVVTRHQLDHEIRSGKLVARFPRALCRPWDADLLRERAALTSVGPPAALSHLTRCAVGGWPKPIRVPPCT